MMCTKELFTKYFEETGISRLWFATQIGMSLTFFYQVTGNYASLPKKYWRAVIRVSKGKITLHDLLIADLESDEYLWVESLTKRKCIIFLAPTGEREEDE